MSYLLNVQKGGVFLLPGPEEAGVLGPPTPAESREVRAGTTVLSLRASAEVTVGQVCCGQSPWDRHRTLST